MKDEIIIQKVLEGETDVFRLLVDEYKDMVYSIAMSIVKNEFDADEIAQLSFLKAYEKLSTFKGLSKFSTWLYRIVVNESFKLIAKKKNELVAFVDEESLTEHEMDPSILKLEKDDQKNIINEALLKLPSRESLVLRLFYLNENSIEEITNITGWTPANIKVILHRARMHLKQLLINIYKFDKKELY